MLVCAIKVNSFDVSGCRNVTDITSVDEKWSYNHFRQYHKRLLLAQSRLAFFKEINGLGYIIRTNIGTLVTNNKGFVISEVGGFRRPSTKTNGENTS